MTEPEERPLRASEVGQYVFCPRAWWLANMVQAEADDPTVVQRGIQAHRRHARKVRGVQWVQWLGWLLLGLAGVAGVLALLK